MLLDLFATLSMGRIPGQASSGARILSNFVSPLWNIIRVRLHTLVCIIVAYEGQRGAASGVRSRPFPDKDLIYVACYVVGRKGDALVWPGCARKHARSVFQTSTVLD